MVLLVAGSFAAARIKYSAQHLSTGLASILYSGALQTIKNTTVL